MVVEMECNGEVSSATEVADTYTPPSGSTVRIKHVRGHAVYSQNSVVMLVWKYDHGTESEEVLWSTKGEMSERLSIKLTDTDGTRKLGLVCSNGENGALIMTASARIRVEL